jgi:hypothetical protein
LTGSSVGERDIERAAAVHTTEIVITNETKKKEEDGDIRKQLLN